MFSLTARAEPKRSTHRLGKIPVFLDVPLGFEIKIYQISAASNGGSLFPITLKQETKSTNNKLNATGINITVFDGDDFKLGYNHRSFFNPPLKAGASYKSRDEYLFTQEQIKNGKKIIIELATSPTF